MTPLADWFRRLRAGRAARDRQAHYEALEADLTALIDLLEPYLMPDQLRFLREENAAGEYGLTLETVVDYLVDSEQEETVGPGIRRRIHDLAGRMQLLDDSRFDGYGEG